MRVSIFKTIDNPEEFKLKLLFWSQQFREIAFYDNNSHSSNYSNFDVMLGVDAFTSIRTDSFSAFESLSEYQQQTNDYILGYLSYDLKNGIEKLKSQNLNSIEFPDLFFFQPKKMFFINGNKVTISYLAFVDDEIDLDWLEINEIVLFDNDIPKIQIKHRTDKNAYLAKINKILDHIKLGNIYEANFCMEFYANEAIDPLHVFLKLNKISKPPFAAFFKNNEHYALSASPERFLKKEDLLLITQPIKGTAKRSENIDEDEKLKFDLENDIKERAENIMIVDLVRNDLSKTAQKGTVIVKELCKVYTFNQVHQMISTIESQVKPEITPTEIIWSTFPMGSMTGAPKISAMEICEELEDFKRGLYSGAIGYFTPNGDFDFNVVIRSILYNKQKKYFSYGVGGAITAQSIPENEYEECLIKANAFFSIFK